MSQVKRKAFLNAIGLTSATLDAADRRYKSEAEVVRIASVASAHNVYAARTRGIANLFNPSK